MLDGNKWCEEKESWDGRAGSSERVVSLNTLDGLTEKVTIEALTSTNIVQATSGISDCPVAILENGKREMWN